MLFAGMVVAWLQWVLYYPRQVVFTPQEEHRAAILLEVRRPARLMVPAPYRSQSLRCR